MLLATSKTIKRIGGLILLALAPPAWAQFSPLTITTTSLPSGIINNRYSAQISSNGSPSATWSAGGLPPGITLTGASGPTATISGTPTAGGTYSVSVQVFDPQFGMTKNATLSLFISSPLVFNTTSPLPPAMVGMPYSQNLSASGGSPSYTFTGSTLPPGLSLTAGGTLFGTPTVANIYNIAITVTDQAQASVTTNLSLTVTPALKFVTTSPLPSSVATAVYTQAIVATGGTVPYNFVVTDAPPLGLTLTSDGILNGVPSSIGTFTFTVLVTDHLSFTLTGQFKVTFTGAPPLLQVSPSALSFSATGGNAPPPQSLSIVSTNGTAAGYAITVDSGTAGSPAPSWLTVNPVTGTSPARVVVTANPAQLTGQSYKATIHVTVPKNTAQASIDIPVTFALATGSLLLQPLPQSLAFGANVQTPGIQQQTIVLNNGGGAGSLNFTATIVGQSTWITGVTPASGSTAPNAPVFVSLQINSQGLNVGAYHDILRVLAPSSSVDIPVSLFVASQGPVLALNVTGLRFQMRQGSGSIRPQNVPVLNLGGATVNWTASLLSGSNWLSVTTPTGTATPGQPGTLTLVPSSIVATLPAGPQYALVQVSDGNSLNSPQYLAAVLDNQPVASPPLPDPSPAGLFFNSSSSSKQVLVYTSTTTSIGFQASASTTDGAPWLSVSPSSGIASTSSPGQLSVSVNSSGLTLGGIYSGSVNIGMSGVLRVVNVTLVVTPPGFQPAIEKSPADTSHATSSCTGSALAITETGLANNFAVPAGWPAALVVQLNDNCGNSVPNGSVVASFSNGDPPLSLHGDQSTSVYSATWQPGVVQPQMTIALQGTAGNLRPATAQLIGAINANSATPPTLLPNGTLHIFFNESTAQALGAGLAPGNVAQVYGTGLAPSLVGSSTVPLQNQIAGTLMLIGGIQAPIFFVSQSPIAVEVPAELSPNQQYSAIVSANGALSLPITISVVPLQPGMAANPDGSVVAQHQDYSLVTSSAPAHPGEPLTIYLAGMGATTPSIPSGTPTPAGQVPVTIQPTLTLDGQNCTIQYAGLTPTGVGLYQINFTVPPTARSGNLNLVVTQGGISSNTTTLPVSN